MFKLIVSTIVASVMSVSSALAGCNCGPSDGDSIPALAFGKRAVVIVDARKSAAKAVKNQIVQTEQVKIKKVKAKAKADVNVGGNVKCLTSTTTSSWSVRWVRGGRGVCPGQIAQSDLAKLANLAESGNTVFRAPFYIPSKCESGWAKMPVKAVRGELRLEPWNKTCVDGYFAAYTVK